ncbi:unnamed protein product [Rotaria sordida]|uniref:Uncharacterized protein n=1 Tax=Rotaria sordida TaxID=392033 RepID=A0A816AE55_9BILA|nr:unnamed protein product [Rotaria sordida]CAF1396388.1 unnamed protein product [Rotaria sordida]CAF1596514.1 unnamed protein product [Rotaria sordida]CAF3816002.1 unnamed protein product [Rotaria sordida]
MTSYIDASSPTGNGRRIQILSTDLIFGGIDNVFIYPSLDVDRLRNALSRTLSFWPIITGRILVDNDDQYFIKFTDNSIPFTYIENDQLEQWPDLPVVVDDMTLIQPFIDSVQYKPEIEPLLRIKVTRLVRSNEYILGTSFFHMVGDAYSTIHFHNDLSQIYQNLEPILPRPVFERHLLNKEDSKFSLLPVLKLYQNTGKREDILTRLGKEYAETDPINMSFSSKQLAKLHSLVEDNNEITIHDVLCAYIIFLMNKHLFNSEDEYIHRTYMYINYRDVSDSLTPKGYIANAIMQPLSSDFPNPLSLSSIAKTIRQLIKTTRQEDFLQKWVTSANILMEKFIKDGQVNFVWDKDEAIFNSNYKYDWADQVNFGMKNQCRFHTIGIYKYYFRIFQLNPIKEENGNWIKDNGGAEVSFRIPKGEIKEKFLAAWNKDIQENFLNIK